MSLAEQNSCHKIKQQKILPEGKSMQSSTIWWQTPRVIWLPMWIEQLRVLKIILETKVCWCFTLSHYFQIDILSLSWCLLVFQLMFQCHGLSELTWWHQSANGGGVWLPEEHVISSAAIFHYYKWSQSPSTPSCPVCPLKFQRNELNCRYWSMVSSKQSFPWHWETIHF